MDMTEKELKMARTQALKEKQEQEEVELSQSAKRGRVRRPDSLPD
jgi:hypothetical protein